MDNFFPSSSLAPAVWYCSHYLPLVSILPLEIRYWYQTTPALPVTKFAPGVVDTGGKVSMILVVHLDLWISPQIFEKIWNDPDVIFRGLAEDDSWKNLKQLISWHCPFKWYFTLGLAWRGRWNPWRQPPPHRQPTRKWTKYFLLLFRYLENFRIFCFIFNPLWVLNSKTKTMLFFLGFFFNISTEHGCLFHIT